METRWDLPTICLLGLVVLVASALLAGVRKADRASGGRPLFPVAAAVLALWLAYAARLALSANCSRRREAGVRGRSPSRPGPGGIL